MKEKVLLTKNLNYYEGLDFKQDMNCKFILTNFRIKICDIKNRELKSIDLKDISNAGIISDKEIIEKDRSVIARGVVGNVLFGGAGLVLGGLSGLQKKKKKKVVDYLIINYKENAENKVLSFYADEYVLDIFTMNKMNTAINMSKEDLKCPICNEEINFAYIRCPKCKNKINKNNNGKKVIIALIIFICFVAFIRIVTVNNANDNLNIIVESLNLEEDKAENINNILKDIGIDEFESISADELLDDFEGIGSKGYRIKTDFSNNVILYLDSENNVICVRFADEDYYRNGNVLKEFE